MKLRVQHGRVLVPLGILVAILAVAVVCIAISPLGSIFGSMISVSREHKGLKVRGDAHELGVVMAGALHDHSLSSERSIGGDDPMMPARLRELEPSYLSLNPERGTAILEFGGGFYHYGYRIQTEEAGAFRMFCYGENEGDIDDLGTFQYSQGEEAGADQPATALESKPNEN